MISAKKGGVLMLTILVGTDWIANRDEILRRVALDVKEKKGGRILMVPELISHDTERRLARVAGDTSSRFAQVLSFTRLARAVSEELGCAPAPCLDNGGRIVAMAAAVRQLSAKLKSYASVQSRPEFLSGLLEAVDEFKRCCISADDLRGAAARSEGVMAQKLEELSLILEAYNGITANGKRDPRDQANWVLEQIEASDFAQRHAFYIDGFPDLTRQHSAILEQLILDSPSVTISFTCDHAGSKALAFEKCGRSALELISFAKSNSVQWKVEVVASDDNPLAAMRQRLFQGSTAFCPQLKESLYLVQARSVYAECRHAAEKILKLVRQGCRYRDIGIACSDMSIYESPLRLTFGRCGIPVYRSGTDDVLQKNVFHGLFSALNGALNGFDRQDVLRYMKSMLGMLDQQTYDRLENYAIVWGIDGNKWTRPFEFHPRGLGEEWKNGDRELLASLNEARKKLIDPMLCMAQRFREAPTLSAQVRAVADFLEDIQLADRLSSLADYMDSTGDNRSAQILDQLWEILLNALEQLYDLLGDSIWDAESFCRLLQLLLSQYKVGTIPTVLDAVMAGPVSAMRCHQVEHLFVLGVTEGDLPGYSGTSGVLSDREREQLRRLGVPLTGGGMEGLQSEFAEIYGVFASATKTVHVSCSEGQPSFLFGRLASMAGGVETYEDRKVKVITSSVEAAAYLAAAGDEGSARTLQVYEDYETLLNKASYDHGNITAANIRKLYGERLRLSASQIDRQSNCRFAYFLQYGLRAKELKEARVDPAQFGTYFHDVLEKTARDVRDRGGFHAVTLEEVTELALRYSAEYITEKFGELDSSRMQYLFGRNEEELCFLLRELWEELSVSLFEPTFFELGFGDGEEMPGVEIPGAAIPAVLRGYVDRVDQWFDGHNNYFRVVDYKSGKKAFDYCDVFNGMGLQMLLYMYALEQQGALLMGEHPIPVGVQYFSARYPFENSTMKVDEESARTERGKELKRQGLVLRDEKVLDAMEPEGAPPRLNVKRKGEDIIGDCADCEQFKLLRSYVFLILRKLIGQIASGDVSPNPYTRGKYGACSYCPYGVICHKESVEGRRDYKTMDADRFWQEVEKEVEKHGG